MGAQIVGGSTIKQVSPDGFSDDTTLIGGPFSVTLSDGFTLIDSLGSNRLFSGGDYCLLGVDPNGCAAGIQTFFGLNNIASDANPAYNGYVLVVTTTPDLFNLDNLPLGLSSLPFKFSAVGAISGPTDRYGRPLPGPCLLPEATTSDCSEFIFGSGVGALNVVRVDDPQFPRVYIQETALTFTPEPLPAVLVGFGLAGVLLLARRTNPQPDLFQQVPARTGPR